MVFVYNTGNVHHAANTADVHNPEFVLHTWVMTPFSVAWPVAFYGKKLTFSNTRLSSRCDQRRMGVGIGSANSMRFSPLRNPSLFSTWFLGIIT